MRRGAMDLATFLATAPSLFGDEATQDEEVDPDIARGKHQGAIRCFGFENGDTLSCVRWDSQFHITSTDIIRALVHRFADIQRPVVNIKKFEEGVFSDLRCLKPGVDARLELPRSEFLELLYRHHCVRTQKKQKVFYWSSVPHDVLFRDALERDLKREAMGIEPTTRITKDADPSALVVIGGIELPLSVPPTLAAHRCSALPAADALAAGMRVSTATVMPASAAAAPKAPPSSAGGSDTPTLHHHHPDHAAPGPPLPPAAPEARATQPTLSEYVSGRQALAAATKSAPAKPETALCIQRRPEPDYDEYHPTPTPKHSPYEGTANSQDLLDLLSADPNALITQDNIGSFSAILDELLRGTVQAQGRALEPQQQQQQQQQQQPDGFPLAAAQGFFGPPAARSASAMSTDASHPSAPASTSGLSPPAAGPPGDAMQFSQTPEATAAAAAAAQQPMSMTDIDNILASVNSSASAAPGLPASPFAGLFPLLGPQPDFAGLPLAEPQPATTAAAEEGPSAAGGALAPGRVQRPTIVPPPRSTRFSRFHPYLKTMARIAHRGSPTMVNRMPSTADPNVAAAVVNALVAGRASGAAVSAAAAAAAASVASAAAAAAAVAAPLAGQQPADLAFFAASAAPGMGGDLAAAAAAAAAAYGGDGDAALGCMPGGGAEGGLCQTRKRSRHLDRGDDGEDKRRYSCTFTGCAKQFKRHEHLKRHFRTHTGERPYKCPAPGCEKVFARMDNLNQHVRTHVNRKTAADRRATDYNNNNNKPADAMPHQHHQQQLPSVSDDPLAAAGLVSAGLGSGSSLAQQEAAGMMAAEPAMASDGPSTVAEGGLQTGAGTGLARALAPSDLELLSRGWFARNLVGLQAQLQPLPPQMQQPALPLPMEGNYVSLLRKMSRNNRVRIGSGGNSTGGGGGSGGGGGGDGSSSGAPPSLPFGGDFAQAGGDSLGQFWFASLLEQQQQQQQQQQQLNGECGATDGLRPALSLPSTASGSRPASLKRHLDEDECFLDGDVAMAGNCSDGSAPRSPDAPIGSSSSSSNGNGGPSKLARSGMAIKPHTLPA
ncbi:hypothetical protein H4R18_000441 [Coemansia javaensis]|uniref:C2H2-type domain-containing protein n=1 Tax=Coemansia javaensis TaxID=2761396 RepID=A0A9W8HI96_9FUNG|nr:hypothetical protein H4R18_000441 [Coemansia javaensis]